MATSLTLSHDKNEALKLRLRAVIDKKRIVLEKIVIETEMLKVNLDMARQEYMVKVGSLFNKDNQLDLEIIRLRNILHYMRQGMSYETAVNKIAETYYAEQIELEKEQQRINFEEEIYKKREEKEPSLLVNIKKLWKKLIAKFHPDLTQDTDEKQRRTALMQQINKAYQEGDLEQLQQIDQENLEDHETTIENLEDILLRILKEIELQTQTYKELKQSEWYDWMIKIERAKKKHENIFAETERYLLNDIVRKLATIKSLKAEIGISET
ncbi:MAG TPA: hypothetical protein VLF20_05770 [Patescibacteria group bacterium]|nr:hypothetical protein [Patescibacteria group bacterium]